MSYQLVLCRPAKADVRAAARWYELQRPGLGRDFVGQVDAALKRVAESPLQCQLVHRDLRRAIVQRFPYGVFYQVDSSRIVVVGVIHLHRNPSGWKDRTDQR